MARIKKPNLRPRREEKAESKRSFKNTLEQISKAAPKGGLRVKPKRSVRDFGVTPSPEKRKRARSI